MLACVPLVLLATPLNFFRLGANVLLDLCGRVAPRKPVRYAAVREVQITCNGDDPDAVPLEQLPQAESAHPPRAMLG